MPPVVEVVDAAPILARSRASAIHRVQAQESTTALFDRKAHLGDLIANLNAVTRLEINSAAWLEVARSVAFCLDQATIQRADQPEQPWPTTEEIRELANEMGLAMERLADVQNAATQQEVQALCLDAAGCVALLCADTSLNLVGEGDALAIIGATENLLRSYLEKRSVFDGETVALTLNAASVALDIAGQRSAKNIRFAWLLAQSAWRNGAKIPRSVPRKVARIANEIHQVEQTRPVREILERPVASSLGDARETQYMSGPFNLMNDPGPRRGVLARYEYMLIQRRRGIAIEVAGYVIVAAIFVLGLIGTIPDSSVSAIRGQLSAFETLALNVALITYVATVTIALAIGQAPDARQGPFITSRDKTWRPFAAASSKFCGTLSLVVSLLEIKLNVDLLGVVTLILGALALVLSVGVAGWEGHGFDQWERRYLRARARLRWLLPIGKTNRYRSWQRIFAILAMATVVPPTAYFGIVAAGAVSDASLSPMDAKSVATQVVLSIALQYVLMVIYFISVGQGRRGASLIAIFVYLPLLLLDGLVVTQTFIDSGFSSKSALELTRAILVSIYPLIAWALCLLRNVGPGTAAKDAGMRIAARWPGLMA